METITARIYWDTQDPSNLGWGWATRVNGEFDNTGPLDGPDEDATDAELIAALRGYALDEAGNEALDDADIEIIR